MVAQWGLAVQTERRLRLRTAILELRRRRESGGCIACLDKAPNSPSLSKLRSLSCSLEAHWDLAA